MKWCEIFVLILLIECSTEQIQNLRDGKSLLNTFPFNQQEGNQDDHHDHHHDHHHEHDHDHDHNHDHHHENENDPQKATQDVVRSSRQGEEDTPVQFANIASADVGDDGKRCVDKIQMVEETVYEEVIRCDHSYDKRCHTTYVTSYESQQEEECEENFRKTCFIAYEKAAYNETVSICKTPLVKDCDVQGPEICRVEYESECWTKNEEHEVEDDIAECSTELEEKCEDETSGYTTNTKCSKWPKEVCNIVKKTVKKYTPITGCTKEPRELCAPAGCGFVQGEEECYDKVQTVVQDVPKEECNLEPERSCNYVTKLVPKLTPKLECADVPKEVCTRSQENPKKKLRPVIKKWCYIPSEESGLA